MAKLAIVTDRATLRLSQELTALTRFRDAAFERGHGLDFLFKNDLRFLPRYDAVFLRALTDPLNSTYVVARSVEMRGGRVLDHSDSIRICCDKVNMHGHLLRAGVPTPETLILAERELSPRRAEELLALLGSPLVLKAPNSSFSAYVEKVETAADFMRVARRFLRRADRLVVQRFVHSSFDWRVIVLAGEVLAVVRYVFAQERWKAQERSDSGEWARVQGVPPAEADPALLRVALDAAGAIGDSLYGVDLKQTDGAQRYLVIEVNDNPTIAAGEEDQASPDIYDRIVAYLAADFG